MTIIAAKQFRDGKRALFADDCVTMGQAQVSAAKRYRPKLREIRGKNFVLVVASCGGTREVDVVLNFLQAKLEINKIKDTMDLGYAIQTTLIEARKVLSEIAKDPSVGLLILETCTNTLWHVDDYAMFQPQEGAEIVAGSGEQSFFSLLKYHDFLGALRGAVEADEYCEFPIYAYIEGEEHCFHRWQDPHEMKEILNGNTVSHDCTTAAEYADEPYIEPRGMSLTISREL